MSLKSKVKYSENRRIHNQLEAAERRIAEQEKQIETALSTVESLRRARRPRSLRPPGKKARPQSDLVEVIFGDPHGNQAEPSAMAAMIEDLRQIRPDRLVIGGDFVNCGGFLAEHHTLGYVAETEDSYADDVEQANHWLDRIMEAAASDVVWYLEGNHENRVERWILNLKLGHKKDIETLRRQFAADCVLHLRERGIEYFRRDTVYDEACGVPGWVRKDKLYYAHEVTTSQNAASEALKKAGGNIVFFHTHRAESKTTHIPGVGVISAWNPGCLCKRQPLYMHTRPSGWTHGYLVRFISRKSGHYQVVPITIDGGVSYGGAILHRDDNDKEAA